MGSVERHAARRRSAWIWSSNSTPRRTAAKPEPSGSQDMIGLIYPGVNRLDFDYDHEGGLFPRHIESNNDPDDRPMAGRGDPHGSGGAPSAGLQSTR